MTTPPLLDLDLIHLASLQSAGVRSTVVGGALPWGGGHAYHALGESS